MAEPKTRPTDVPVADFLAAVQPAGRRVDAEALSAMLAEVTGEPPVMWGPWIVGFGSYTSVNRTKKAVDWPIIGFSPRKTNLTLYIMPGFEAQGPLLARLGKHKVSGSCLHLDRLADVDLTVLRDLAERSVATMRGR